MFAIYMHPLGRSITVEIHSSMRYTDNQHTINLYIMLRVLLTRATHFVDLQLQSGQ